MLRKIRVYGKLAKFLGQRTFEAAVDSAAEAVRFLAANFPGLERHMADQHYRVSIGTYDIDENELADPAGRQVIKITPVISGAGAVGKIIAGVALIALSFALPGSTIGLLGLGKIGLTAFAAPAMGIGVSLALGGVSQLLSPTPRLSAPGESANNRQADPRDSYGFSGIQNVARPGVPVPIVYGEVITGSVVISTGIDTTRN